MATRAAQLPRQPARRTVSWPWFREFLRWEVASYPGRVNTVIRMTITATLVMIIVVTFRIPNAFLAGLFSILLARENLAVTWRGGRMVVLGFVARDPLHPARDDAVPRLSHYPFLLDNRKPVSGLFRYAHDD